MKVPVFSKMKKEDIMSISQVIRQLNRDQARAVLRSLMANDFSIIEGFPGSGKTQTVVALVCCLIVLGRTVLLTSYTHSAVDNILLKLVEIVDEHKILRLGYSSAITKNLQHLTLEAKLSKYSGEERIVFNYYKFQPIVACTCLAVSTNLLFSYRRFSMTIVDEASMVLEPTVISAISVSDSFVLLGDHRQLTPLVCSEEARQEGMAKSLLERLSVHLSAVVTLHSQYRMNEPITQLSSRLFYENKLQCFSFDSVNHASIYSEVYKLCLSNSLNDAIVFLDTNSIKNAVFRATFGKHGDVFNDGEAEFIEGICKLFISLGLKECDLGVISFYRYHAERLSQKVGANIEVNTVDQYQGKDKSVIVLSFVWTKEKKNQRSDLLADFRRVNVAITRAKHKLIMIGCRKSLSRLRTNYFISLFFEESKIDDLVIQIF
ncbi:unnamed protein product [Thelazia callipaeda]|uniref:DNA replication ATP-dependent helicase/nuclease n=1 Tax=Thelazia callipaeda TaxID=103827 RepID=A0A0N5CN57_THECL|nr:unnamed protein product [Thelazia callipaeda]